MAHIQYVDSLVKEYLLFRGFSNTIKTLDNEIKTDKDKGFRVDKIIDQLITLINSHDLIGLKEAWNNLDQHFFTKLEHTFSLAVKKLENGILKLYLITAYVNNKHDKIADFFVKLSSELHSQLEWKEWFYFPFCKNPEENPIFSIFFTKQWQDTLLLSLHNFLAIIFQSVSQPVLSKIENESILIKKLQEENTTLRSRLQSISNALQQQQQAASAGTSANIQQANDGVTLSQKQKLHSKSHSMNIQSLDDITPFDVSPPPHVVDDFYIIASETVNINQITDTQSRGLKSLIRNISGSSPVLADKSDHNKRRSGSVGRSWV